MSDVNYAVAPAKPRRGVKSRILGVLFLLVGLGLLVFGVQVVMPSYTDPAKLDEFKQEIVAVQNGADATPSVDWSVATQENQDINSWIRVDNTRVDFPVAQTDNNEYYLYHDLFGNRSYSGVFADSRCDVNGDTVLVYGHHMINGEMFADLAHTHHQDSFDSLGDAHWQTPQTSEVSYVPAFAMSVDASYALVQEFDHVPTREMLISAMHNVSPSATDISQLSQHDYTSVYTLAYKQALRVWLKDFAADADARASNVDYLIDHANKVLTTCTCTSSLNNQRTLTVFISVE